MEFFGQGQKRLGKQRQLARLHAHLARAGAEHHALCTHDVADVHGLEVLVGFGAQHIPLQIQLDLAFAVEDVRKSGLAHDALADDAAGHAHFLALERFKPAEDLLGTVGLGVGGALKGVAAFLLQSPELFAADLDEFVGLGGGLPDFLVVGFVHVGCFLLLSGDDLFLAGDARGGVGDLLDGEDLVVQHARGGHHFYGLADLVAQNGPAPPATRWTFWAGTPKRSPCPSRSRGCVGLAAVALELDALSEGLHLGNGDHVELLFKVVLHQAQAHARADADAREVDGAFVEHFHVGEQVFELCDLRFQGGLFVHGGIVFRVFADIAEGARFLDVLWPPQDGGCSSCTRAWPGIRCRPSAKAASFLSFPSSKNLRVGSRPIACRKKGHDRPYSFFIIVESPKPCQQKARAKNHALWVLFWGFTRPRGHC